MTTSNNELNLGSETKAKKSEISEILAWITPQINFIKSVEGQHYITFTNQPHRALLVGGDQSEAISAICIRYNAYRNKWLGGDATRTLVRFLHAQCTESAPQQVFLRAAYKDGAIYVDRGDEFWSVYRIDQNGYSLINDSPVIFTRSAVTSELPVIAGVSPDIELFRKFVNLDRDGFYTLVGCIAGSFFTHFPQPLIFINGPAGTGKSTLAKMVGELMDKTTGTPGANLTKDERDIKARARARRVMAFENVSFIHNEISDILARITTGTEISPRALYTNDESHVTLIKRPVIINGILEGFARSDLASRAFSFELNVFASSTRMRDRELMQLWEQHFPAILAGLFEVISLVLRQIDKIQVADPDIHRNIDLLEVLQCISGEYGCDTHSFVKGSSKGLAFSVLDGCPVGESLRKWIQCDQGQDVDCYPKGHQTMFSQEFTTKQLRAIMLAHLDEGLQKKFPEDDRNLGIKLKRVQTALTEAFAVNIEKRRVNACNLYKFIKVEQVQS